MQGGNGVIQEVCSQEMEGGEEEESGEEEEYEEEDIADDEEDLIDNENEDQIWQPELEDSCTARSNSRNILYLFFYILLKTTTKT